MPADLSSPQSQAQIRAGVHVFVPLAFYLFGAGHTLQFLIAWFGGAGLLVMTAWVHGMRHYRGIMRRDIRIARTGVMPNGVATFSAGLAERRRRAHGIGRSIAWISLIVGVAALLYVLPWPVTLAIAAIGNAALLVTGWATMRSMNATLQAYFAQMKSLRETLAEQAKAAALAAEHARAAAPKISECAAFAH